MGLILTYLFTPPLDYPTNVNIAYGQVVKIFHTEIHHHYHGSKSEDREAFGFGLILMALSAWLYLDYGQTVLAVLTFVAAFIVVSPATFITMRLLAQAGEGWLFRLAWPAVVAILAAILALQEEIVVDYLVANGMNFRHFLSIAGSDFFTTMLYHIAGSRFWSVPWHSASSLSCIRLRSGVSPIPKTFIAFVDGSSERRLELAVRAALL